MTEELEVQVFEGEVVDDEPPVELTAEQRAAFIAAIEADRNIGTRAALLQAGVGRTREWQILQGGKPTAKSKLIPLTGRQADELIDSDPDLRDEYERARGRNPERIRQALQVRAIDGIDEPVFNKDGEQVATRKVYSDRLLEFAARMWLPEAPNANRQGDGPQPVVVVQRGVSLDEVADVLRAAGALRDGSGAPGQALSAASPVLAEPVPEDQRGD